MKLHNQIGSRAARKLSVVIFGAALSVLGTASYTEAASLRAIKNFTGVSRFEAQGFIPPDTVGAVGPNHIALFTNGSYSVYDKSTNALLERSSLDQFFDQGGPIQYTIDNFTFDPRVIYDSSSERWFAAAVDNARELNKALVGVSTSSNPLDGWTIYPLQLREPDDNVWSDFPTLGINNDFLYLTTNNFPLAAGEDSGVSLAFINKDTLISGDPLSGFLSATIPVELNDIGFTAHPATNLNTSESTQFLLSAYNSNSLKLTTIEFDAASGLNFIPDSNDGFIPLTTSNPPKAQQPDDSLELLEAGDTRFGSSVVFQDDTIWATQTVNNDNRAAIRWLQIDPFANTLLQSGLIADPELDFYYPSIAVNDAGEVVIGFSGSGSDQFASSYAVLGTTTSGTTTFDDPLLLRAGTSSYEVLGNGRNRWGDYSATVVDPSNPKIFWTFQERAAGLSTWSTQITALTTDPDIPADAPEPLGALQVTALEPAVDNSGIGQFSNVPSGLWFTAPDLEALGFTYSMTSPGSLFTEILNFPTLPENPLIQFPSNPEIDPNAPIDSLTKLFDVLIEGVKLGTFGAGDSLDFVSLLGQGVPQFSIFESDPTEGEFLSDDFALQLAFNTPTASFSVTPVESVPEPASVLGLMGLGAFFTGSILKRKRQLLKADRNYPSSVPLREGNL